MPRSPRPRLLLFGSANTDLSVTCPQLPRPGETVVGGDFHETQGGKGANQAVAAARAGARVVFVGARGNDARGRAAARALRAEGIDISHFRIIPDRPSGVALILIGGTHRENLIAVAKSANEAMGLRDVRAARAEFKPADLVLAQLEIPLSVVSAAARSAHEAKIPFLLNPAPARALPDHLLPLVHTLTPNLAEAAQLSGEKDPERAGQALLEAGCRQVVITLGSDGALYLSPNKTRHFRTKKCRARDTVGAGDCFSGWLAAGLAEQLTAEDSIQRALRAASLSVTRKGAQDAMPLRFEID